MHPGHVGLRRSDVGIVHVGARADLHVLDAPSHDYLAYRIGVPLTYAVWSRGSVAVAPVGGLVPADTGPVVNGADEPSRAVASGR